jgi:indolepyruvate ferredoxin oxidoreductase beta subunit
MKYDILLSGVGGQGVLSMAAIIGLSAVAEGLGAKQSEVHGMAQRGGAVQAHLRLSDRRIESDLIPKGSADLVLSMEPLESLRYLEYLSPMGTVVTATSPVVNIPDYPEMDALLERIRSLPRVLLVEAERLAEQAGDSLAMNTVMVGAASHLLPVKPATLEDAVRKTFARKGQGILDVNIAAFHAGRAAAESAGSSAAR